MEENVTVLEVPEVMKNTEEWYRKISFKETDTYIRSNIQATARNVIATGYFLKHIRDDQLYLGEGYKSLNELAWDRYGFSASTVSRYIARNTKFSKGGNSPYIDEKFKKFNKSQLQEMLGMSDEQLEQVTPDMTVREIRSMARPKEIPYIEIPGQTELKDIPGVMPEERMESFEASTEELFGVEEDEPEAVESVAQSAVSKPISQEIPVAELVEEKDTEIATSQMLLEDQEEEGTEESSVQSIEYDLPTLKMLIQEDEKSLSLMGDYWIQTKPYTYAKYFMRIQALKLLMQTHEQQEEVEASKKENKPEQPELPQLKNNDQRAAFIDAYETWPLWIDNQETGERYYRYDFLDGTSFVIKTYHSMLYDWKADVAMRYKEGYGANEEYLLEPGKFFRDCRANRTTLIEKLKEIQKGGRQ